MVLDTVSFGWHTRATPDKYVVHVIREVLLVKILHPECFLRIFFCEMVIIKYLIR